MVRIRPENMASNPQCTGKLFAKELLLLWQNAESSEIQTLPFYFKSPLFLKCYKLLTPDFLSVIRMHGIGTSQNFSTMISVDTLSRDTVPLTWKSPLPRSQNVSLFVK
jgi:hypothetical protein